MLLQLERPLVFFDIEATGVDVMKDRIVELALVRLLPDGTQTVHEWRVNPEMPIPKEASAVHHISDADVATAPTFKQLVSSLIPLLTNVDLAGYNARRFDVPMLEAEFDRVGIRPAPFADAQIVDAQEIFYQREPRTLAGALRFYCQEELQGAHGARQDTLATVKVLQGQLDKYADLPRTVGALVKVVQPKERFVDPTRRLVMNENGEVLINFGHHRGSKLSDMARNNRGYLEWILSGDWHPKVHDAVKAALNQTSFFLQA